MMLFGGLALLLLLAGPLALVLVLLHRRDLKEARGRQKKLEDELAGLRRWVDQAYGAPPAAGRAELPALEPIPAGAPLQPESVSTGVPPTPPLSPAALPPAPSGEPRIDLETILGGQWLTWVGILAIFFGTAFFLAYDLESNPIAGTGQVLTGLMVGALFIAAGRTLAGRLGKFLARGLLGGGVALLYLSAYASYAFHHLVPAAVVFPFLFGVAIVGTIVALSENSLMVATLTLAGALLTPFFVTGGQGGRGDEFRGGSPAAFFAYLAAVNLGTALLTRKKRWPILPLSGFLGTVILVGWWWSRDFTIDHRTTTLLGITVLWLLNAIIPLTARAEAGFHGVARAFVLVANAFLFELALYALMVPDFVPLRGMATALLSLAYVAGGRLATSRLGYTPPVRLTRLAGLGLAALAVPVQFDLQWVTLGWAILAVILLQSGFSSSGLGERLLGYFVLFLATVRALVWDSVETLSDLDRYRPILNGNFVIGIVTAATLGLAAWMLSRHRERLTGPERRLVTPLILTAAVVLLVRITMETIASFAVREILTHADLELAVLLTLSLVWAVYAGLLILGGFLFHWRPIRYLGIGVLAILVLKVFLLDMQKLDRGYRIASFVGVGLLLLFISILYQKEQRKA
jgi:uncharacterized membrane protein